MSNDMPTVVVFPSAIAQRNVDYWNVCPGKDTTLKRLALFK